MHTRSVRALLTSALLAGASAIALAATPTFWEVASLVDFLKGDLTALAIDSDGRLTLGPASRLVTDTASPMIWQLLPASDGSLLAGTGNEGRVFRIGADGKMTTAFDSSELEVHALAPAPDGGFYAGTSPEGKVYRVALDGSVKEIFDPQDKYIWALAAASDGTLYVATGEKGIIYRVAPDGTATPFYRTRATNVMALTLDVQGNLLAGTSSPGQVFRIDRNGKGFVLLDSNYAEVRALRLDPRGTLYAVAISGGPQESRPSDRPIPIEPSALPVPSVSTEITITAIGDVSTSAGPMTPGSSRGSEPRRDTSRGAIYRIAPDGLWESIWEASEDVPYDVAIERDGTLLVATGQKGRLLRLAGDPVRVTVVARADAQQITSLSQDRQGRLHFATANPGKLFELSAALVPEGTYESDVKDAASVASWGLIRWRATTPTDTSVRLMTRSGNTRTPDDTWSPWSGPYSRPDGEAVTSPKARYLQWKAVLAGKQASPTLTAVTIAYLPRNNRPAVVSITVHPPGVAYARPFPTGDPEIAGYESGTAEARPQPPSSAAVPAPVTGSPAIGRRICQKGLQTIVWKADDELNDRLQFDVSYRRQGDTTWVPLRRALWDPILTWDTSSVLDGTYTVKIVATDAPSNAPGAALTGERESETFDIDNSAPAVVVTGARTEQGRTTVGFTVTDNQSAVDRVEYLIDATRWRMVYPLDGIADSKEEKFEVTLDPGVTPPVMIRAVDALNNVGSAQAIAPASSAPPR